VYYRRVESINLIKRNCPICESSFSQLIYEFQQMPLGDNLMDSKNSALSQKIYPMKLVGCKNCFHIYLPEIVTPELSYSNYHFSSGLSPALVQFMCNSIDWLSSLKNFPEKGLVLDIGANDGTWLELFLKLGYEVFGVEPSVQFELLKEKGISGLNCYFNQKSAEDLKEIFKNQKQLPSIICVNNTLANISNLSDFFANLLILMNDSTLISIITGYHFDQFAAGMFDYVYHEHFSYFSVSDFINIANKFGLEIIEARKFSLKGGSIQIVLRKKKSGPDSINEIVLGMVMWEKWILLNNGDYFYHLSLQFEKLIVRGRKICSMLKPSDGKILGYGFSHSSTTLIYELGLTKTLTGLIDDNNFKHGKYVAGLGLQIFSPKFVTVDINCVIILSWQHDLRIVKKLKELEFRGHIVHPLQGKLDYK